MSPGLSGESLVAVLARYQHSDEQADTECHSNGFVGMGTNHFVGGLGPFNRLFFQAATGRLCRLKRSSKTLPHFVSLLTHYSCRIFE